MVCQSILQGATFCQNSLPCLSWVALQGMAHSFIELDKAVVHVIRLVSFMCHSKHLPTTQRRLYTWTSPDGQHRNQIDYILCSQRRRSSIQSAKTRPGADCGLDHEIFIAKFRLKLKKVGKTTRPFRYDLNQIPCSGNEK